MSLVPALEIGLMMPFALVYGVFLPPKLGTFWSSADLPIYLPGLVMVLVVGIPNHPEVPLEKS